jgi:hypothetical protein
MTAMHNNQIREEELKNRIDFAVKTKSSNSSHDDQELRQFIVK